MAAAKSAKRELTAEEKALVEKVTKLVDEIVQVDVFDKLGVELHESQEYVRPALRHTKFAFPIASSINIQSGQKVAVAV